MSADYSMRRYPKMWTDRIWFNLGRETAPSADDHEAMSDSKVESKLIDWRESWLAEHQGQHVALLVPVRGEMPDRRGNTYESVRDELSALIGEPTVGAAYVDPSTGASGFGIGAIWEIVGHGADLMAWIGAAMAAAPKIREAAAYLSERYGESGSTTVYLSAEAAQVLCVADLCESGGINPLSIEAVNIIEHNYHPVEPTIDSQQFYSAYTVTIAGHQADGFYYVWNYLVTCHGIVVSRSSVQIPIPNGTHWREVRLPNRKLKGLL